MEPPKVFHYHKNDYKIVTHPKLCITLQTWVPHLIVTKNNNTLTQRHFSLNKVTLFHNPFSHTLSVHVYFLH